MRKLTWLVFGITALGFPTVTLAAAPEYFVGGQLGYQDNSVEYSDTGDANVDLSSSGIAGGVFAGVKFYMNDSFFIAPEVSFDTSNASGDIGYGAYKAKVEASISNGLGVLLGSYLTAETSIYGRLGYKRTEYELTISDNAGSLSEDDLFDGVRYGVGVTTALTSQTDLRIDWSQTRYADETYTTDGGNSFSFEPAESLFQVGFSYKL